MYSVLFENDALYYYAEDCSTLEWDTSQGTFPQGPWCAYVPNWDGVDALKNDVTNRVIA